MKIANVNQNGIEYKSRIIIENIQDLEKYFEEYVNPRFSEITMKSIHGSDDIDFKEKDPIQRAANHAILLQHQTGRGAVFNVADMESKVKTSMAKWCCRGYTLMCNIAGGWNIIEDGAIVEIIGNTSYSKEDIRIMKFPNGAHWYAKIKDKDVVIDGEQKWNAKWVAQKKAEQFLSEINKESKSRVG